MTETMKFSLAFLVVLALSGVVSVQSASLGLTDDLNRDLQEFVNLVPQGQIKSLFEEYKKKDDNVLILSLFLEGDGFRNVVRIVDSMDEMLNIYQYLQESDVNINGILNKIHEALVLPAFAPGRSARSVRITGSGVAGLLADIKSLLPVDDFKALFFEKLSTSPAFVHLIERLREPHFHQLIVSLRANDRFQEILSYLKFHDIDVRAIVHLFADMFQPLYPDIDL